MISGEGRRGGKAGKDRIAETGVSRRGKAE